MAAKTVRIGISTCPNDTFAFDPLLRGTIDTPGIRLEFRLLDIDALNRALFAGELDVGKASFHAALHLADRMAVLASGAALGFGVGPLLLAAPEGSGPGRARRIWLCPGEHTTAHLLLQLFHGAEIRRQGEVRHVVFSDIMPALRSGAADYGACIHEGRFTWRAQGLRLVEDLGTRWEQETASPLPLGGLLIRRDLPAAIQQAVARAVRASVQAARAEPATTLPTMRNWAKELDDAVIWQHVQLYVNDWTVELGATGLAALHTLRDRAIAAGLVSADRGPLTIVG